MDLSKVLADNNNGSKIQAFIAKYKFPVFFIIVVTQLLFSGYKIDHNSLWSDECFSVYSGVKTIPKIIEISKADVNPPLYAIILHYWMKVFGQSEYAVRILSAFAMALASGFLFLLAFKFFNWQTAVFSFFLFFTSNAFFYYSQEARTYGLVVLFAVLSHYAYLKLLTTESKREQIKNTIFLAITYGFLFYFHFLSCFLIVGHCICILFFLFARNKETNKFQFNFNSIKYYFFSGLLFLGLLSPFYKRFLFLVEGGQKKMWLQKPSYEDLKRTIYELFNSKEIFQYLLCSVVVILILVLLFKKLRSKIKLNLLIFAFIAGPVVLYINYLTASTTPIFLLRYVLFTYLGFILFIAYVFSSLNLKFELKLIVFIALMVFSFSKMKIPKEANQNYKGAVKFLNSIKTDQTLITTDLMDLYAYYYDKKIFNMENDTIKHLKMLSKNILVESFYLSWQKSFNFDKYKYIYYTQSFAFVYDHDGRILEDLNRKFKFIRNINTFPGVYIVVFENTNYHL